MSDTPTNPNEITELVFYLPHYYDKSQGKFVPFLYVGMAQSIFLNADNEDSVADMLNQLISENTTLNASLSNKVPMQSVTYTIPGKGWYRIAKNVANNARQLAQFDFEWIGTSHGVASFIVSSSYGKQTNINQLGFSANSNTITEVRVVQNASGTSASYQSYLEIYHTGATGGRTLSANMLNAMGWELLPTVGIGDIPDGFNTSELAFVPGIKTLNFNPDDLLNKETLIKSATAKTTLVDADTMPLSDSTASSVTKKITWANVKAVLKDYFDTLYNKTTVNNTLTSTSTTAALSAAQGKALQDGKADLSGAWTALPLINGATTDAPSPMYNKQGNIVCLRGVVRNISGDTAFATLPSGYRPKTTIWATTTLTSSGTFIRLQILANGNIAKIDGLTANDARLDSVSFMI